MTVAVALAGRVIWRNYHAAMLDFEPWPTSSILGHPEQTGLKDLQEIRFSNRNGATLAGWYRPGTNHAGIVLTHGTNADRSQLLPELRILAAGGFSVLAFDWPGDGDSAGVVRWDRDERDALESALDWLESRPEVHPRRIGGLGFSMGGYVMTQVASFDTRLQAVVVECFPPDFLEYLAYQHRRWGPLSRWPAQWALRQSGMHPEVLVPRQVIGKISPRPVLIIGGAADTAIPPEQILEIFAAARQPKWIWSVPAGLHGGFATVAPVQYPRRLLDFFRAALVEPPAPGPGPQPPS